MKRTPLQRRTPMSRGKPVLKPQRLRDTGPSRKVRDVVKRRAGWKCERCGLCPGQVIHHRDPRGAGGSSRPEVNFPSNLVYICEPCHLRVESRRLEAIGDGWLVQDGYDPRLFRIRMWHDGQFGEWLLKDDGSVEPVPGCAVRSDNCDCK